MAKLISATKLREDVAAVLRGAGSADAEAAQVAANLVLANLSGHDSHGVGMVPRYVDAVLEGGLVPNASARVTLDAASLLSVDGQRGYGQVVGEQAMRMGMARAKETGSCILALANAHHLGRIGHFAEMAVAQGLVSIHFVNVMARAIVAPWGGADGRFGTNPCCIGVPLAGQPPFVLDFATSRVAQGKMRVAHNEGREVEPGLLIDSEGKPTTDPGVVVVPQPNGLLGALLPFGEHKGYGLAVACELLGGALTGGGTWHRPTGTERAVVNGMLTIVIDPSRLTDRAWMLDEIAAMTGYITASPPARSDEPVLIPGDPERANRAQRLKDGVPIDEETWREITLAARGLNVLIEPPA